jgi:hypothetical protein
VQIIDVDAPEWADPDNFARAPLDPRFDAPELPFTTDPVARHALAAAPGGAGWDKLARRRARCSLLAARSILTAPDFLHVDPPQ